MLADHFIMTFILFIVFAPIQLFNLTNNSNSFESTGTFWILMFIYFNKDAVGSRSISKRLNGFVLY